jgi:hypothetical protein
MLAGANQCACGYDHDVATAGRPQMSETMGLPDSPLMGRGFNFNMSLGIVLCLGGVALAACSYLGIVTLSFAHPYLVAAGAFAMGLLRYGRGAAQCRSE